MDPAIDDARAAIEALVHRETQAWDEQNLDLLLSLFHPDMVWPWPPTPDTHDPAEWVLEWGRFDEARWRRGWGDLFASHNLVHNRRTLVRIAVSAEGDGGFAVVDVDTLWRRRADGTDFPWQGRACKIYTRMTDGTWKMIAHTGLLNYATSSAG